MTSIKRMFELLTPPIVGVMRGRKLRRSRGLEYPFDIFITDRRGVRMVFDVGANIGEVSMKAYRSFPEATIYSFEPVRNTFETLKRNTSGCEDRMRLNNFGFFKEETTAEINLTGFNGANSMISQSEDYARVHSHIRELSKETIRLRRLDDFVAESGIEHIDILKIDVEGVENDVIDGGEATLCSKVENVIIEISFLRHNRDSGYWLETCQKLYQAGLYLQSLFDVSHYMEEGVRKVAQMDAVFSRKR